MRSPVMSSSTVYRNLVLPFLDHMITEVNEQQIEPRLRLLTQYLIPSRLPECVEESGLFGAYASDCVYDEREVELWRRKWRAIPVKERPAHHKHTFLCTTLKDSYQNIYTALTILAMMPVSATIAEQSFSLQKRLKKHDDARSVDWTRSLELSPRNTSWYWSILRDFDPLNDCRILLAFN